MGYYNITPKNEGNMSSHGLRFKHQHQHRMASLKLFLYERFLDNNPKDMTGRPRWSNLSEIQQLETLGILKKVRKKCLEVLDFLCDFLKTLEVNIKHIL